MAQPAKDRIATVFFLFDLNSTVYQGLLDILYYQQRTGLWPPIPAEPVIPPVVLPPAPPPTIKKIRVKVGMSGWVRKLPDSNSPSVKRLRPADGAFDVVEQTTGWVRISLGWLASDVVEYL